MYIGCTLNHCVLPTTTNPDIDAGFKSYLTQLAPILLSKEKLKVKKIMGTPLTGKGLLECFKVGLAGVVVVEY